MYFHKFEKRTTLEYALRILCDLLGLTHFKIIEIGSIIISKVTYDNGPVVRDTSAVQLRSIIKLKIVFLD